MTNWIEEAEKRQAQKETKTLHNEDVLSEVVRKNQDQAQPFINELSLFIDRIQKISPEERKPSVEIGHTHIHGEDTYEFYGSAVCLKDKKIAFLFTKSSKYLYWRRIIFKITSAPGIIYTTIHEKQTISDNKRRTKKKKNQFNYNIDELTERHVNSIIDWLVYRISNSELIQSLPHHLK